MDWESYTFPINFDFPPTATVLDIGCGWGIELAKSPGAFKVGIEPDEKCVGICAKKGLTVMRAEAENLPFADKSVDGIICKGILPFTEEESAIREIGRVLKDDGKCYLVTLGSGYYFRYLLLSLSLKFKLYGSRALLNTWMLEVFGMGLPGFLGDTVYSTHKRLEQLTAENRLRIISKRTSHFLGFPVFVYTELQRVSSASADR
jgi:SAM-dependent methyltransferase